jgi:hypothetical protein
MAVFGESLSALGGFSIRRSICLLVRLAAAADSWSRKASGTERPCAIVWTKMFCVKIKFGFRLLRRRLPSRD